ncbi:thioredoxin-dependent thiol peroxidase [Paenibacillus selenitireducens]|jgi:peroxiredoxin Q/BCP|uniref:thioredoxin-dependent peroxiredoxin n=1 Tax=Paenibacillus selenitireducens TaxID=1324314 RepID=A0A1T2X6M0_9BACL|nr:thioredoxin-dependent thiol peroxidase [Paenibacillus selenitireducens]OPA75531.1 thioredoxin-dependent thiol peroxidase [Paenibacillus selenitireducens]
MADLQLGQPIPDFTLPASNGENVSLSDYRGKKLVIYFYPKSSTPACTQESCDFRDFTGEFSKYNTEVIGISGDASKLQLKFIAKNELPFLLLADTEHEVCRLFGVWQWKKLYGREFEGIVRSTFVVDEEGKLAAEWRKVRVKEHVHQVLEAVKQM